MDRLFRIDFYPHDWLTMTGVMTPTQRGIFIQIVALIYANRGPIENDPAWIGRASNCSARLARSVIEQLVGRDWLQLQGSKISQRRCERELDMKRSHLERSSNGGRKKHENGRDSSNTNGLGASDASSTVHSPSPSPSPSSYKGGLNAKQKPTGGDEGRRIAEKILAEAGTVEA